MTIKEQAVSDAMIEAALADLRDRRLLKWLFRDDADSDPHPVGYVEGPIDLETQREIVTAIYLAMKAASHPLEQQQAVSGDVVERVARALARQLSGGGRMGWDDPYAEIDLLWRKYEQAARAALTASGVGRMREALEPFAKAADIKLCGEWADDKHFGQTDVGFYLTFGDLRRARTALQEVGRDDD